MAASGSPHATERTEIVLAAWRRFSYEPLKDAERRSNYLARDPAARAEAVELLLIDEPGMFSDSVGAALDDPGIGKYGLLTARAALQRLYDPQVDLPGLQPDIASILPDGAKKTLQAARRFLRYVVQGSDQLLAQAAQRGGNQTSEQPDPSDVFGWLCDMSLPCELRAVFIRKAEAGIIVTLLDAAVHEGLSLPAWMADDCCSMLKRSYHQQLSLLVANPSVHLAPSARRLAEPADVRTMWLRHESAEQGFRDLIAAYHASGLDVYRPFEDDPVHDEGGSC